MKMTWSDNQLLLVPETVKEALAISKIQQAMHDDGLNAKEEEMEDDKAAFAFGILRRPGPQKRQPQEQPEQVAQEMAPQRKGAEMVPEPTLPAATPDFDRSSGRS